MTQNVQTACETPAFCRERRLSNAVNWCIDNPSLQDKPHYMSWFPRNTSKWAWNFTGRTKTSLRRAAPNGISRQFHALREGTASSLGASIHSFGSDLHPHQFHAINHETCAPYYPDYPRLQTTPEYILHTKATDRVPCRCNTSWDWVASGAPPLTLGWKYRYTQLHCVRFPVSLVYWYLIACYPFNSSRCYVQ